MINGRHFFVAIDFDGTVVTEQYPDVGKDIGAVPWLQAANQAGADLILLTMRDGPQLDAAVAWFETRSIRLFDVNANTEQAKWTKSRKVYANIYVDDLALGAPLIHEPGRRKPFLDWSVAGPALLGRLDALV